MSTVNFTQSAINSHHLDQTFLTVVMCRRLSTYIEAMEDLRNVRHMECFHRTIGQMTLSLTPLVIWRRHQTNSSNRIRCYSKSRLHFQQACM